jgi:hypothetical protein
VHLACTRYLTLMHTGDRSAEAIDAGGVLPGYTGIIVRDGYAGYGHLTNALHAWCGAHYADTAVMPMCRRPPLVGGCPGWRYRHNHRASRKARRSSGGR